MEKNFVLADLKAAKDSEDAKGAFEAILSSEALDRDGEVILKGAFEPLPGSIPVHAFHDFTNPVGRARPYYEDGVLKVKGTFASTPRAQEIRALVTEGVIASMSVGFRAADRADVNGVQTIKSAEILEGSFVSIPANSEAAVLLAKEYVEKAGARNSSADQSRIQNAHDLFVDLGAKCASDTETTAPEKSSDAETKSTTTDPEDAAAPAAAPLADVNVAQAKLAAARAQAELLLLNL